MAKPQPRKLPTLPDELIEEVLIRDAPDDPASLVRAALACRRWCRLVADPAFRRRRLELHRATPPPMLGVLCNGNWDGERSSARPAPITTDCGRPTLAMAASSSTAATTGICAATGVCDHLDCHRGPFIVVVVGTNYDYYDDIVFRYRRVPKNMFSCIYSSAWSKMSYADHPGDDMIWTHSALVGNALFFSLSRYDRILKYDLGTGQMDAIRLPYLRTNNMIFTYFVPIELTTLEDGRLGFARVEKSNELCLWSMGEGDDVEGWTLCKIIDLKDMFPLVDSFDLKYCLVGFAESVCLAIAAVQGGLFAIDMKSGLMKIVFEDRGICCAVPYINFCTPSFKKNFYTPGTSLVP